LVQKRGGERRNERDFNERGRGVMTFNYLYVLFTRREGMRDMRF
jgi:hypothetical protein